MASRGGRPYGSYMDRQSNSVANQGGVYAGADLNIGAKIAIQQQNREMASAYSGADNEQNWDIAPDELLFTMPCTGSTGDIKMAVLGSLNGLGAVATQRYVSEPDGLMMIRECVKNQIQVVGAAYQAASFERGNVERGITVQMGGLKTLRMGNGQFGDDRGEDNTIKPGDLVCADVPMPGKDGLHPGVGARAKRGVPATKYTLQLRRCSPESAGHSLVRHIRHILKDPTKWQVAMGEHCAGTNVWATAAHEVMNSYLTSGVLFVRELMAAGILVPSLAGQSLVAGWSPNAQGDLIASTIAPAIAAADANVGEVISAAQQLQIRAGADVYAFHLAELLRVIPTQQYTQNVDALAAYDGTRQLLSRLRLLRVNALQRIFYDGTNAAFEFGFELRAGPGNLPQHLGRFASGVVNIDLAAGAFLEAQLNHVPRAVAGFHSAILKDMSFMLGKASTGASTFGSGNAHVFLGACRP